MGIVYPMWYILTTIFCCMICKDQINENEDINYNILPSAIISRNYESSDNEYSL